MVSRDADAAVVRIPPPLVYLAALGLALVLHVFLPFRLALPVPVRIGGAGLIGGFGVALVLVAVGAFRRTGQSPKPWKTTPEFIATGMYRVSRNPMYVGMGLVLIALGIGLANGWIPVLVPAVLVVVHQTAIRPEEAYLEKKFGDSYRTYKHQVRRWL